MNAPFEDILSKIKPNLIPDAEYDAVVEAKEIAERRARGLALCEASNLTNAILTPKMSKTGEWGVKYEYLLKKQGAGYIHALVGERGNGKTQMAVELVRESCRGLRSAWFQTAMGILMWVRGAGLGEMDERLTRLAGYGLLVIDEIGRSTDTGWDEALMFELINRRYLACRGTSKKDTLLIGNVDLTNFEATMGKSAVSRIMERGGIIQANWPAFRKPIGHIKRARL